MATVRKLYLGSIFVGPPTSVLFYDVPPENDWMDPDVFFEEPLCPKKEEIIVFQAKYKKYLVATMNKSDEVYTISFERPLTISVLLEICEVVQKFEH